MLYKRFSVFSVLATAPLGYFATPLALLWDDMLVKHTWYTVPAKWESVGRPSASATIDLHFALKPHRENALIDTLYNVSDPRRSTHVLLPPSLPLVPVLTW
jgi:tripeptidyl-peptidase-1